MFCTNCGANVPDGTQVCPNCGNPMQQAQPQYQQPQYQQPQYQQPEYQQPQYQQPQYRQPEYRPQQTSAGIDRDAMNKREFIAHTTNKAVKRNALVVTVTMLLCLALLAGSVYAVLAMPFYDIPVMSAILDLGGVTPVEVKYELQDALAQVRYHYNFDKQMIQQAGVDAGLTKTELELAEQILDSTDKLAENMSVLNFRKFLKVVEQTVESYTFGLDMSEFNAVAKGLDVVIGLVIGFFFLPLLFTLLGGLLRSSGLTVTGLIFTLLAQIVLCGWLFGLISLVLYITQVVFCSKITKAYRSFTLGLSPL